MPDQLVEQSLQLAFALVDRQAALVERIGDLLGQAAAHLRGDHIRALYFATEALGQAETANRPDLELSALRLLIDALDAGGRSADALPYIVRAIDLAESTSDADLLASLVDALGAWAISIEQVSPQPGADRHRAVPGAMRNRGAVSGIDDPETGLLNALGLAAELLSQEERQTGYALIQIVLSGHSPELLLGVARSAAQFVGDRGLIARNGGALLTAVLPGFTGIAAMSLAEHLRRSFVAQSAGTGATIGIGVTIKQSGESTHAALRRVTDRAEEASRTPGVSVAG